MRQHLNTKYLIFFCMRRGYHIYNASISEGKFLYCMISIKFCEWMNNNSYKFRGAKILYTILWSAVIVNKVKYYYTSIIGAMYKIVAVVSVM